MSDGFELSAQEKRRCAHAGIADGVRRFLGGTSRVFQSRGARSPLRALKGLPLAAWTSCTSHDCSAPDRNPCPCSPVLWVSELIIQERVSTLCGRKTVAAFGLAWLS